MVMSFGINSSRRKVPEIQHSNAVVLSGHCRHLRGSLQKTEDHGGKVTIEWSESIQPNDHSSRTNKPFSKGPHTTACKTFRIQPNNGCGSWIQPELDY